MIITVKYFAQLRDRMKRDEDVIELSPPATPGDVLASLIPDTDERTRLLSCLQVAINHTYQSMQTPLHAGDELVFIPPVAGG